MVLVSCDRPLPTIQLRVLVCTSLMVAALFMAFDIITKGRLQGSRRSKVRVVGVSKPGS